VAATGRMTVLPGPIGQSLSRKSSGRSQPLAVARGRCRGRAAVLEGEPRLIPAEQGALLGDGECAVLPLTIQEPLSRPAGVRRAHTIAPSSIVSTAIAPGPPWAFDLHGTRSRCSPTGETPARAAQKMRIAARTRNDQRGLRSTAILSNASPTAK